ncbi:hypothetical protein KY289_031026 [Solanum tuberosum]|nr:hypothetical protein KY289_031026 [Solanum tuberosum]
MMNIDEIPHDVHTRLKKVYLTLFCAMLSSTFGSYLQWILIAGGKFTVLSCVASLIWIYFTPPGRLKTRVLLLMLAAYSFGASISAYINYFYKIEQCQEILFNANLGDIDFVNCTFTAFFHLPGTVIHAAARLYLQDAEIGQHN